jgi:hypothetical protein
MKLASSRISRRLVLAGAAATAVPAHSQTRC